MSIMHLKSLAARLGLAALVSGSLISSSLPGAVSVGFADDGEHHVDEIVLQKAATSTTGTVRVIITREHSGNNDDDVRSRGGQVKNKLDIGNATVAEIPANQVAALAASPGVVRVSYDAPVKIQADPLINCCDSLQSAYPRAVDAARYWNDNGNLRGTGIGVAVLDTGVRDSHPDFLGANLADPTSKRVTLLSNGVTGSTASGVDDNGHGTFVAGIIAGRGWGVPSPTDDGNYIGIAPDASIISIKVSDYTGMAHVSDVISAVEWVSQNRQAYNIRVLNLSMVSNVSGSYKTDMLDAAVELAWLQGMVIVVAAGNGGPNAPLTSPANDPYVITVGATDDMGTNTTFDDQLAPFSSYGTTVDGFSKPDLVAPGRRIVSTLSSRTDPLGVLFPTRIVSDAYISLSGTSASAPVVSGLVAQLLQARPTLNPGQVKWLLTHTSLPIAGPGTGAGYPRLGAALAYSGTPPSSNSGLVPNNYLAAAYASQNGLTAWDTVSWNTVSWNTVSWNTVSWNTVSWNTVSWNTVDFVAAD
jgi:serine protease AprX